MTQLSDWELAQEAASTYDYEQLQRYLRRHNTLPSGVRRVLQRNRNERLRQQLVVQVYGVVDVFCE